MSALLKPPKAPSPTLRYLILSNLLSLVYLFRLHNGEVDGTLGRVLLDQLLSPEGQKLVTDVESAYYFHLKTSVAVVHDRSLSSYKPFEPLILEDLVTLLSGKLYIVESLMREYDLLHLIIGKASLLKRVGLAK